MIVLSVHGCMSVGACVSGDLGVWVYMCLWGWACSSLDVDESYCQPGSGVRQYVLWCWYSD